MIRRNSRASIVDVFGVPVRRSRREASMLRAEDRAVMDVGNLAAHYRGTPTTMRGQRAAQKAINAIFLRGADDLTAIEAAMLTLPANYGADQLGEWYAFTKWAIKTVGRHAL